MERDIPEREVLIQSWIEKEGLTVLGGDHKVGKSIVALNLAICLALGSDFLDFKVIGPRKALLYQQEISEANMKVRLNKLLNFEDSELLNNLAIKNTTGNLLKITNKNDREDIYKDIEDFEPDLVIFDPLSTFHDKKENDAREMSSVLDNFFEIKNKFKIAILLTHHYGKPQMAQRQGSHKLRGHTIIGDRADTIIIFNRLPEKYKNISLKYPIDHYAEIQFVLRNDANPGNIVIERDPETLWYKLIDFYNDLGRKILPRKIKEILEKNGGAMEQKKLVPILCEIASRSVVLKAIQESKEFIEEEELPGRGKPKLLKLKEGRI